MKVFFYRYGSVCEPDIIEAFNELGLDIVQETKEITLKDLIPSEVVKLVSSRLQNEMCDFAFSVNFFPALSEVCRIYNIPYLSWTVDSPVLELFTESIKNNINRIFLFDKAQYREVKALNPACAFHLPLAANPVTKDKVTGSTSDSLKKRFANDVAFVGSLYTEKSPYDRLDKRKVPKDMLGFMDGLMASQELIYGYYLPDEVITDELAKRFASHCKYFRPQFSTLHDTDYLTDKILLSQFYIGNAITARERVHLAARLSERLDIYTASDTSKIPRVRNKGTVKTIEEMPLVFSESKINLNFPTRAIRTGVSFRIFDVLSSGGFLLTNYQEELSELFEAGRDLDAYGSPEEMEQLISYYLSHEKERKEIARNGYETVRAHHTFTIRMEQMLKLAFAPAS